MSKQSYKMTRQEFRTKYLAPLEQEFGVRILWNGKGAQEIGRAARSGTLGVAYTKSADRSLTLLWQRDWHDTLQTAFHEVAHLVLHGKGGGCSRGKFYRECEAETTAKLVCEKLGEPYRPHFRGRPDLDYIAYFWRRYLLLCKRHHRQPAPLREKKIAELAERMARTVVKYSRMGENI